MTTDKLKLTAEQIKKRLAALDDYEMSLHRNLHDPYDVISDELDRVFNTRMRLQAMLKDAAK